MEKAKSKTNGSSSASAAKKSSRSAGSNGKSKTNGSSEGEATMMEEFLADEIKDIYWAEKHLLKALPKLEKAATSSELKKSFADHTEVTREHVSRLEEAFEIMGKKP